jgi:hypothetical protein
MFAEEYPLSTKPGSSDSLITPKSHASLSPWTNLLLIVVWTIVVAYLLVHLRLPLTMAFSGGVLGAVAGVMQHQSISRSPEEFRTASSLMGVRRAFTSTPGGRKYIGWLYFGKLTLLVIAFLTIHAPFVRVIQGYLAGYFSLMLIRDVVTLRDTFALNRLGSVDSDASPNIS